jgi:hypothetical protein
MTVLHQFINKQVEVEISGKYHIFTGKLIDVGLDLLVLYHELRF